MFAAAQVVVMIRIMLVVLLLDPRSFDTFTLPKSVAAHVTSLVLAALLIWLVTRHGRSVFVWTPTHVGAGAVLLAFALATPLAIDPTTAVFGVFRRYLGLTQMLDNVLLYLSVGILFRDIRSLRLLVGVGIGVAVPVLLYALVQKLGLDPLSFEQGEARVPISTLGNPDIAGAFVSVIGASALGYALLLPGGAVRLWRLALALVGLACLGILYATGVRAGVLAIGTGWLATIVLCLVMPHVGRSRRIAAGGIAVVLALGIAVSPIGARMRPDVLLADQAFMSRIDIWTAAARAVVDRPILGVGPDNFAAAYPPRRTAVSIRIGELQNSTHDIWLYAATSAGIVGLAALLFFVALLIDQGLRLARRGHLAALALVPLAAYLGQALVNVNEIAVDQFFWISAGVVAAASSTPVRVAQRRATVRRATAVGVVALGAAAALAVVGVAPRLVAGEAMLATEAYAAANRALEALPYGQDAVSADPRRAEIWSSLGVALYKMPVGVPAAQAFTRAAEQQPWHPLRWKNLSLAWAASGNRDAAYAAAARAVDADPYDGQAHDLLASLAYDRGDYVRASQEGRQAMLYELTVGPSLLYTTISAYVQLKDLEHAEPLARDAASRYPTSARLRLLLAAILTDEGKFSEALSVVNRVLEDQPNNADALALKSALVSK